MKYTLSIVIFFWVLAGYGQISTNVIKNPIINGYFADPSIVKVGDTFYIYATIDPWGGDELGVFETKDFKNFEQKHLNWPTKKDCTSPTSGDSKVWAPSVVKAPDGKFYMYVSVGSEVWAGTSENPLGPWKNLKANHSPLIPRNYFPGFHMIDAECFVDTDSQAYLYWGSGLGWVNGHCFAVKLNNDMTTFVGKPLDITPPNYFEAPFMYKRKGVYYLMYSEGKAIDQTYKVRYSTGKTPMGPWTEGVNSPILTTSADSTTYGPGHHAVFTEHGQSYILYHRIFPQKQNYILRQLCIDSLNFDLNGNIKKVIPKGVAPLSELMSGSSPNTDIQLNTAIVPVSKLENDSYDWWARHAEVLRIKDSINPEIVLIGNSITHFWGGEPKLKYADGKPRIPNGPKAWDSLFHNFRVLNLGFGWDRTQNVLWRIDHGELDGLHPRTVIIDIGTNNTSQTPNARINTAPEIVEGIRAIYMRVRSKVPGAKVILMAIFPREESPTHPRRMLINEINKLLEAFAREQKITFVNIGPNMLTTDGTLTREIASDFCHPTEKGYQIWADAIRSYINEP